MRLSKRLRTVAGMVPECRAVADVGCDHGYLGVWLLREGIAGYAYEMDVRPGPLAKAAESIRFFHMQERAETILSDGLIELMPGAAEVIVMAGMGGELMTRLLTEGAEQTASAECLVLQPQSDPAMVRRRVYEEGFRIEREECVFEDEKYYVAMKAVRNNPADREAPYTETEYRYGRCLPAAKDVTYLAYLTAECEKKVAMVERLLAADTAAAEERLATAAAELSELAGVIRGML